MSEFVYWHIAETDEWITDEETANSAEMQGLSVCPYTAEGLVKKIQVLEAGHDELRNTVHSRTSEIESHCYELVNSASPITKNMQANFIMHEVKAIRKDFGL